MRRMAEDRILRDYKIQVEYTGCAGGKPITLRVTEPDGLMTHYFHGTSLKSLLLKAKEVIVTTETDALLG